MQVANTIQLSTVANLLATELRNHSVELPEDSTYRDSILLASAEYLLMNDISDKTQISELPEIIKNYIKDTQSNYPNYFSTGESY